MNKVTICLCMIVKNEIHNLPVLFKSVIDHIDGWCIFDTGSTDGTQSLIINYFNQMELKGHLYETEWINFSHNRNQYLDCEFVKQFDYILTLDADEQLVVLNDDWKYNFFCNKKDNECNLIKILEKNCFNDFVIEYWNPYLFSTKIAVKYEGVTHETLTFNQNDIQMVKFDGIYVKHNATTDLQKKCERDINVINKELSSNISIPSDIKYRYYMYLGKSYARMNGEINIMNARESFEKAYEITQNVDVYIPVENIWETLYQMALIGMRLYFDYKRESNWIEEMLNAYHYYPKRVEPLGCLICYYCIAKDLEKAKKFIDIAIKMDIPKNAIIEVDTSVYEKIIPQYHEYIVVQTNTINQTSS